ncbi:MAG: hypothetical protein AB3N10_03455, partial [Allomuricauda sp.]
TKYSDCIDSLDLSKHLTKQPQSNLEGSLTFGEMDSSLKKYRQSMDSVVNNLTALEAHQFLHAAYNKYRNTLQSDSLSEAKTYYLLGAMRICYQLDKSLNLTSDTPEKNAK